MAAAELLAPQPPGWLGATLGVTELRGYLEVLGVWLRQRRRDLDALDGAAQRSGSPDAYTPDVLLAMSLWQAAGSRLDRLKLLWDNGRADATAREQAAQVIWSRTDSGTSGLPGTAGTAANTAPALTLPETGRLIDALVAQLRARLAFDPRAAAAEDRMEALRASLARLAELVAQEPTWAPQITVLDTRIGDLAVRAAHGDDVDATLAEVEAAAARAERDLIVLTAARQQADRDRQQARELAAALAAREPGLHALVAQCAAAVQPVPRLAVPEVAALGDPPPGPSELAGYLNRLRDVGRAMDQVETAYRAALSELEELTGLLAGYRSMAAGATRERDRLAAADAAASRLLQQRPCPIEPARAAVAEFSALARQATGRVSQ